MKFINKLSLYSLRYSIILVTRRRRRKTNPLLPFWKKVILSMSYLLIGYKSLCAQKDEQVIISVSYRFIHVCDTNNKINSIDTEMLLQIGKTNSKYSNQLFNKEFTGIPKEINATSVGAGMTNAVTHYSGIPMAVVYDKGIIPGAIYQSFENKRLYNVQKIGIKDYLIEDTLPFINWKITNESRIIGSYTCQRAIGELAGRMYIAWFTTDIPIAHGPWKLFGLPGLILEAKDTTGEVQFLLKELNHDKINMSVFSPTKPIKITWGQFIKAERDFKRDPIGTISAQAQMNMPSSITPMYKDATGKLISGEAARIAIAIDLANPINNPIEKF